MQPAYEKLGEVLAGTEIRTPSFPVVCNVEGRTVRDPDDIRQTLVDQVTGSVRWVDCITCLLDKVGCDTFLELGPGTTLAGMIARIRKGTAVQSLGTGEDAATLAL
jgi:[acyl-carrier-protein] S-malonyltransferase